MKELVFQLNYELKGKSAVTVEELRNEIRRLEDKINSFEKNPIIEGNLIENKEQY